jgi:glycosyltransferase involved in cell wall biosynthesis
MDRSPRVSAVIPVFNSERFLAEAIESVLRQTHPRMECIVVDDGSEDNSVAVARSFGERVSVVEQSNAGVAAARNRGAAEAHGEVLAFLDADDVWRPERVERQLEAMRRHGAEAVLCASTVIGERPPMGRYVRLRPPQPTLETLLLWRGTVVSPGSCLLIGHEAFDGMGGFDPTLSSVDDWELLTRLVRRGRLAYVDELLVDTRWHEGNVSRDLAGIEHALRRAYSTILAREGEGLEISHRRAYGGFHRALAAANLRLGHRRRGLGHALRAVWRDPSAVPVLLASRLRSALLRRE